MNEKEPKQEDLSIEYATALVGEILAEVSTMGANDSEIPELLRIREGLEKNELSPVDAVRKAREIQAKKMDYH